MAARGKRRRALGPSPSLTAPSATRCARTHSASTPRSRAASSVLSKPRLIGRSCSRRTSTTRRAMRSASTLSGAWSTTGHQEVSPHVLLNLTYMKYSADHDESRAGETASLVVRRAPALRETTEGLARPRLRRRAEQGPPWRQPRRPLDGQRASYSAAARAAAQLPKVSETTLADGQSPSLNRRSASPARRSAWVWDQS